MTSKNKSLTLFLAILLSTPSFAMAKDCLEDFSNSWNEAQIEYEEAIQGCQAGQGYPMGTYICHGIAGIDLTNAQDEAIETYEECCKC